MSKRRRKSKRQQLQNEPSSLLGRVRLPQETFWFVLVNVLDYLMTYIIVYSSNLEGGPLQHRITESNPIAAYFINRWGLEKGLLAFKFGLVAAICLITQRIALRQPRTARWVLNLGTLVTGAVVLYSVGLLLRALG